MAQISKFHSVCVLIFYISIAFILNAFFFFFNTRSKAYGEQWLKCSLDISCLLVCKTQLHLLLLV